MKTEVDYLRFRTLSDPYAILEAMRPGFGSVGDLLTLGNQVGGVDGWTWRRPIVLAGDVKLGAIDYGGHHMRGVVRADLPGDGCEWVQNWRAMAGLVDVLDAASIKRLDLALTTYRGEVTHEMVLAAHDDRQFGSGGRHPHRKVVDGSDPRAGRTIYIGKRESGKFLRAYEKGWEVLKDIPSSVRDSVTGVRLDGVGLCAPQDVYRVEVEFKDKDDRVIPWTALVDRDPYFAGAYPFCASLLPGVVPRKVQALPAFGAQVALATSIDNCRRSYGAILRAAYEAHGRNADKVLAMLMSEKPAQHLIEAGILMVAHD